MRAHTSYLFTLFLLSATGITGCTAPPPIAGHKTFLENSTVVQQAKRTYQIGHNAPLGTDVSWLELATCLPAHWQPRCPQGGTLKPGPIGQHMICSVHGQLKPGERP